MTRLYICRASLDQGLCDKSALSIRVVASTGLVLGMQEISDSTPTIVVDLP